MVKIAGIVGGLVMIVAGIISIFDIAGLGGYYIRWGLPIAGAIVVGRAWVWNGEGKSCIGSIHADAVGGPLPAVIVPIKRARRAAGGELPSTLQDRQFQRALAQLIYLDLQDSTPDWGDFIAAWEPRYWTATEVLLDKKQRPRFVAVTFDQQRGAVTG